MVQYKVQINEVSIELNIMNRKKVFYKDDIINEDIYTNTYPMYFKKIGTISGTTNFLSTPYFIPDNIDDFIKKEKTKEIDKKILIKEDSVDVIEEVDTIEEVISPIKTSKKRKHYKKGVKDEN